MYKIRILLMGFFPRCPQPIRDLKILVGTPPGPGIEAEAECWSGTPRERRRAQGDFQIPDERRDLASGAKSTKQKKCDIKSSVIIKTSQIPKGILKSPT